MLDKTTWQAGHFTRINEQTGSVSLDYDVPNQELLYHFVHSGFTTPAGRKFVDPTPGEYVKARYSASKGYVRASSWRTGTNLADYSSLLDTGAMNVVGAPSRIFLPEFDVQNFSDETYNKALTKLYDNVKVTESNLALTLGEARESKRMLGIGKSIYGVLTIARKAKRDFLRNPSKSLSSYWLGYQLGWKPLLNDIHNYLKWNYTAFNEGIPIIGRSKIIKQVNNATGQVNTIPGLMLMSGKIEWRTEIKVWAAIADTSVYNASRITSFNPLSIAWELVPLSFVVDWFYDIGGWLQNMEAAMGAGLTFKRGYVTEVVATNLNEQVICDETSSGGGWSYRQERAYKTSLQRAYKRRQLLLGFPFPRAPTFKAKLGSGQIITAAALLRVILLGKVR